MMSRKEADTGAHPRREKKKRGGPKQRSKSGVRKWVSLLLKKRVWCTFPPKLLL
jgi:hypothetical protein